MNQVLYFLWNRHRLPLELSGSEVLKVSVLQGGKAQQRPGQIQNKGHWGMQGD